MRNKKTAGCLCASLLLFALAGCSFPSAPAAKTAANQTDETAQASSEKSNDAPQAEDAAQAANAADTEKPQQNASGKWHVLDPEVAAAVDADFMGMVKKIAEGAFSIAETKVQILEDGSLASSSPSSKANIPDSQLVHVIFDDDTYFYIRTISGSGESYEDTEAGFQDLQENMSVEMKGSFENDVFYAAEIRIIKFS